MPNEITEERLDEQKREIERLKKENKILRIVLWQVKARLSRIKEKTLLIRTALRIIDRALEGEANAR